MDHYTNQLAPAHPLHVNSLYTPTDASTMQAHRSGAEFYTDHYNTSLDQSNSFWLQQATATLDWIKQPTQACNWRWNTEQKEIYHRWFEDGIINVSYNCLDRHLTDEKRNKTAIIWQGEQDDNVRTLTYAELYDAVCRCALALKASGINKGDRVCLYLPMVPELAIAMLACARIGAIHSVVFGGFSSDALAHRLQDCSCRLLITADVAIRNGKEIHLKAIADEALVHAPCVTDVWVIQQAAEPCSMQKGRDRLFSTIMADTPLEACPPEPLKAEDPLFILYTSGSTGKPKGVVHTQAGYLLQAALTHQYLFDIRPKDVYWCTADLGWVTGHSYVVYGPLANATTVLMYEGSPTYPDMGRCWQIIDKHAVNVFYTAPTLIRTLIKHGDEIPLSFNLSSLLLLASVGEPINPETWMWFYNTIGKKRCPLVDTWWQTETGGIMIAPLQGSHTLKPGCAGKPFYGVAPLILNENGIPCTQDESGYLCITRPWPGMMRTMWNNHDLFIETYFSRFDNVYCTGDGCRVDADGDYWLQGRIDDVVNVSGHRLGTAEIESALVSHTAVAEAAVVPVPHAIKGQSLYAYLILIEGYQDSPALQQQLHAHVRHEIGSIAIPEKIIIVTALPKTRSGKIMRRILRKIAEKDFDNLGDISTLADPHILQELMRDKTGQKEASL